MRRGRCFVPYVTDYYLTDPISRASPTMAECSASAGRRPGAGGGVGHGRVPHSPLGILIITIAEALCLVRCCC